MHSQPLIAVRNVETSSVWYQKLLGCESGHGGAQYERIVDGNGRIVLQLHQWDAHEHLHLGDETLPHGNGLLLWFQTDSFDAAVERARMLSAEILEGPQVNQNAQHREIWLRDPNGYVVVIAGRYGDV